MKYSKILKIGGFLSLLALGSCSSFNYKTYDEKQNENVDDPEPNYELTLDPKFQDFTNFMFIGNRIENFSTYFNTYFNASENFNDAYDDYVTRVLTNYNERQDSIFAKPRLSQESIDKFNIAIEKASKVIQYHKSSEFMDKSVLLVGKSYYFLGDYLKAERKFSEFISRLKSSRFLEEALLYLAKTQLRLDNEKPAIERFYSLIKTSNDKEIVSESYQSIAEYYLNKKDYDNGIINFKKAIEYSRDSEFKSQMQFLVASVTARSDPKAAAVEFDKVLDYDATFELEYVSRYNAAKNLISSRNFSSANPLIENLIVKYKDSPNYLGEISFLKGNYYEEKKEQLKALKQYYDVMKNYPSTVPAAEASFRVGKFFEEKAGNYLNALRYYRYSTEQNTNGANYKNAQAKMNIFKRYYELRSEIIGSQINTDYDLEFYNNTKKESDKEKEGPEFEKEGDLGKSGGAGTYLPVDSLISKDTSNITEIDSASIKEKKVADATFELAELFLYNLNRNDSCEYYLQRALDLSGDYDFKAKVLFALASLYQNTERSGKSEEILRQIVEEFPLSSVANSSRRLLNISLTSENSNDSGDSIYSSAENHFISRNYDASLAEFKQLIDTYPGTRHLEKALYAAGWIYENVLLKSDSAYYYYSSLIKTVPNSEAAAIVMEKVEEYETFNKSTVDTTGDKTDSLSLNNENINDPNQLLKESETNGKNGPKLDDNGQPIQENDPSGENLNIEEMKKKDQDDSQKEGVKEEKINNEQLPVKDPTKENK
jgi:tetratricopeptide (TPR) repeat protein